MCILFTQRIAHGKPIPVRIRATITWQPHLPFAALDIAQRGETDTYLWSEEPDDLSLPPHTDRIFVVFPASADPLNEPAAAWASSYTVKISESDPTMDCCTCDGWRYSGRCKHTDSFRGLIQSGELPHPMDEAANMALGVVETDGVPF